MARRKNKILCDKCKKQIEELTEYGMKNLPKGVKFTGLFCDDCDI